MRSGELARLTGVSADTLRHYEKLGILATSQRTTGGYRMFPRSASVERVQLAQRALRPFKNGFKWPILGLFYWSYNSQGGSMEVDAELRRLASAVVNADTAVESALAKTKPNLAEVIKLLDRFQRARRALAQYAETHPKILTC